MITQTHTCQQSEADAMLCIGSVYKKKVQQAECRTTVVTIGLSYSDRFENRIARHVVSWAIRLQHFSLNFSVSAMNR